MDQTWWLTPFVQSVTYSLSPAAWLTMASAREPRAWSPWCGPGGGWAEVLQRSWHVSAGRWASLYTLAYRLSPPVACAHV